MKASKSKKNTSKASPSKLGTRKAGTQPSALKKNITKSKLAPRLTSKDEFKRVQAEIVEDSADHLAAHSKEDTAGDSEIDLQSELDLQPNSGADPEIIEDFSDSEDAEHMSQLPVVISPTTTKSVTTLDPLTLYLQEIQKYPVLSREKEMEVAKKYYDSKDPAAAELLVKSNLRFVVKVAAEYAKFSAKMIDLIQEGNVGLMHAVKEYNPYKGNRLITYAVWWIRGYIQEYLMRQFSLVRIGTTANQRKLFYQLRKQKEEFEKMNSPEAIKALSKQLDIPEDEIREMTQRMAFRDVSLDKPVDGDDDSVSLGSLLKRSDGSDPIDDQLALAEQIEKLKEAIEKVRPQLSEKEKIILEERVLNEEPLTLQEIGEKYKITREAVRQNEVRLINKIKTALGL